MDKNGYIGGHHDNQGNWVLGTPEPTLGAGAVTEATYVWTPELYAAFDRLYPKGWKFPGVDVLMQLHAALEAALRPEEAARQGEALELPQIPDDDADFTPDLARKIIAGYQKLLATPRPAPVAPDIVPVAWMHPHGAIWRADNCPADIDFTKDGWIALAPLAALSSELAEVGRERDAAYDRAATWITRAEAAEAKVARPTADRKFKRGDTVRCDYDGFVGTILDPYTTREGRLGWNVQLLSAKVVHVYGEDRLELVQPFTKRV